MPSTGDKIKMNVFMSVMSVGGGGGVVGGGG